MSLQESDKAAAAVAKAPRVTLDDIQHKIVATFFKTGDEFIPQQAQITDSLRAQLSTLTVCVTLLDNGFTVVGKSAPASPENFDKNLGQKFAREDAMRQCWPLMGYALRDRLSNMAAPPQMPDRG